MIVPSKPLYALLALFMPISMLYSSTLVANSLLPFSIPAAVMLFASLAGLAAQVYCELMKNTKSSRGIADFRGAAASLILSYALSSLCRISTKGLLKFFPSMLNVTSAVGALYLFIAVVELKKIFAIQEILAAYTETYQGEDLQKAVHENADLLITYNNAVIKTLRLYAFHLFCLIILAVIKPAGLPVLIFLSVLVMGASFISGLFRTINHEHYCAGQGIAVPKVDRAKRIRTIALYTAASGAAALILTSRQNLLPVSLLFSILLWLLGLLPSLDFLPEDVRVQLQESMYMGEQSGPLPFEMMEPGEPWKGWEYINYGFIVLLVAAFIFFMVKPLFARYAILGGDKPLGKKIQSALIRWFRACAAALKDFFALLKQSKASLRISDVQKAVVSISLAYSGARERRLKGSLTLFARLIVWGTAFVVWKPSYPPAYYCALVAACVPAKAYAIIRCGELFECALYSERELSKEESQQFKSLIDEIAEPPAAF